jgi:2-alkyl-3-oxoalkanoate reductase
MTKTIAVTGASGFVGGSIARHFAQKGWRVIGFGRKALQMADVDYRQWDIRSPQAPFALVVHSAAMVDDFGPYHAFYDANVVGTQHVLTAFRDAKQFVQISSPSVYDPLITDKIDIDETFPYGERYLNAYGETKMLAEKLVLKQRPLDSVILRPRAVYGVGDTTLLPRLMRAKRGRYLLGIGDGTNVFSLTYIGNLLHALDCVVDRRLDQAIFNIADDEPISMRQLLTLFAEAMGWQVELVFIPRALALSVASVTEWGYQALRLQQSPTLTRYSVYQLASNYTLNLERAKAVLGYQPPYRYQDGFARIREALGERGE